MKQIALKILALFFPWLVFLIEDDPVGALIALLMQASIIGWLPASIWAWRTVKSTKQASPH
jgi:uncharacterized membrane protein YqaE (UPF0057 family)